MQRCMSIPVLPGAGRYRSVLQEACVHILKIHRILIASGIVVCLVYAGREVATYSNTPSSVTLIHAALAVVAAVALGIYLHSIRRL